MSWIQKNKGALIFSFLVGLFILYSYQANPPQKMAARGDNVSIIAGSNSATVPVATTKEADDEYSKALHSKDQIGYDLLFSSGKMFRVDAGTKALVIDRTVNMAQLRILEGKHQGKSGWVPIEFARLKGEPQK